MLEPNADANCIDQAEGNADTDRVAADQRTKRCSTEEGRQHCHRDWQVARASNERERQPEPAATRALIGSRLGHEVSIGAIRRNLESEHSQGSTPTDVGCGANEGAERQAASNVLGQVSP